MSRQYVPPKLVWQAEDTHPDLIEPFKKSMREIEDPELGLNIIELGLVRDLKITESDAEVRLILTTPFCPYGPALMEMTRKKAEEALARPVTIQLGMEMWEPSMMEDEAAASWGFFNR